VCLMATASEVVKHQGKPHLLSTKIVKVNRTHYNQETHTVKLAQESNQTKPVSQGKIEILKEKQCNSVIGNVSDIFTYTGFKNKGYARVVANKLMEIFNKKKTDVIFSHPVNETSKKIWVEHGFRKATKEEIHKIKERFIDDTLWSSSPGPRGGWNLHKLLDFEWKPELGLMIKGKV